MQVRTVELADHARWSELVRQCGGHGLHMPGVSLAEHEASSLHCLAFEEAGQVHACAMAVLVEPGRLGRLRGRRSVLQLPTAPAITGAGSARAVRAALFEHARELGAERLVIQPGYGSSIIGDEDLAPYRTASITEFVLDLTQGHEALLAAMHKVHRKNIRRARRSELEIVEDVSVEGLLRLRSMQMASSQRAEEKTEGFGVRDEDYFLRLHEHVYGPGLGTVLFAQLEDEAVAALAWLRAAGRVLTVRSGSLPLGYESRAMYLLHDELIRRSIAESMVELNIGGVPAEAHQAGHSQAGLYEFKQGFGGQPMARFALDIPLGEIDR
jgi:hypothetical protein